MTVVIGKHLPSFVTFWNVSSFLEDPLRGPSSLPRKNHHSHRDLGSSVDVHPVTRVCKDDFFRDKKPLVWCVKESSFSDSRGVIDQVKIIDVCRNKGSLIRHYCLPYTRTVLDKRTEGTVKHSLDLERT